MHDYFPYSSSVNFREDDYWYDGFMRNGANVYHVFYGGTLLARVENEQQARNLLNHLPRQLEFDLG